MFLRRSLRTISGSLAGLLLVLLLSGLPVLAQSNSKFPVVEQPPLEIPETSETTDAAEAPGLDDPQELEYLIDSILAEELAKSTTPGTVISVVKDGEIFFAKGYGYADVDRKTPVVADRTLFRVASLSKLVTATAAMQLYEQGLIDLDDDVSQYLDFELDNPYPEPVTFAQIMTHTDGTTKRRIGLAARTEAELEPLAEHLPDHMPPIVWHPGELYSYSSYSIALLGYLIERVTNTPFIEYIDEHILQPLNMQRSTFLQPPPPSLANDLATGYQKQGGNFQPVPYLYLNIYPGAAFQTTAIDMAHFMIAHLQLGQYQNQRILKPDVAQLMHTTHFTHYPGLPGTSYSFREQFINNIRTIGHLGSLRGYSSSMTLLPDRNIGIFIASNSFSGVHGKIIGKFFDRYFPVSDPSTPEPAPNDLDLSQFTGYYRDLEYPRHTLTKISGTFKHIQIIENNDNTLTIQTPNLFFFGKMPQKHLVPIDLPLFRRVEDNALTAFGEDSEGSMFAFNPIYPKIGAYVRVPWYETIWAQLGLLGFCALFFLSACIAWLIRPLIQRLQGKSSNAEHPLGWALRIAGLIGLLNLAFLIGFPLSLWLMGVWKLAYGMPPIAIALLCLPILATALTLVLPATAISAWVQGRWSLARRWHYSVVTLAALAFIPFLTYWNLLGFQF
ncbi:MAG: serine hydrolase [Elainellaceae cyanobacterium]